MGLCQSFKTAGKWTKFNTPKIVSISVSVNTSQNVTGRPINRNAINLHTVTHKNDIFYLHCIAEIRTYWGSVIFYREGGSRKLWGIRYFFLDQKGDQRFFKLKRGDHLYFVKETIFFVKHFRFQRKGFLDATGGRKLQWDLLSQCKNVQLHSRFDVDFS